MNRRDMLKLAAGGFVTLAVGDRVLAIPAPPPEPTWFTQKQLLNLFKQLDVPGGCTSETVDLNAVQNWNGKPLEQHELAYLAIMRMSNIMYRKTLDSSSQQWIAVSPEMCERPVWYDYVFCDYSTPGKPGGKYIRKPWQTRIRETVAHGVYNIGCLNNRWRLYVCEGLPDNKMLLGMGHRLVVHYKSDGTKEQFVWNDGTVHEYPKMIPYMDKPTRKNYAVITLKD